ncbi:MAG: hypothetical protein HZB38_11285 [Planctomycetes bacterium]|nr:hypothetical protein [Planctomycetota bacterium]
MTGSPVKTAKRLTKLMLLLDCVREAVIAEMPDRNMDMYDSAGSGLQCGMRPKTAIVRRYR